MPANTSRKRRFYASSEAPSADAPSPTAPRDTLMWVPEYVLTRAGRDLAPIVQGLGRWALRWVDAECSLGNLDVRLLMWNMRRNLRPDPMPARRVVVEFHYPELPADERRFWLIVAPGNPFDLCSIDPGHEFDLLVTAGLRAMTSTWMGMSTFEDELAGHRIELDGDPALSRTFTAWVGRSGLAP